MAIVTAEHLALEALAQYQDEEERMWEQRRYEIAKDLYVANQSKYLADQVIASGAIHKADILIKELRK